MSLLLLSVVLVVRGSRRRGETRLEIRLEHLRAPLRDLRGHRALPGGERLAPGRHALRSTSELHASISMRVTSSAAVPSASTVSEPAARHSSVNSPKMPSVGGCDCAPVAPPSAPGAGGNGARKSAGGCVAANDASDLAPSTSASSPAPRAAHATASFAGRNAPLSAEAHRAKCARRVVSPGSSAPLGKTSPDIAHSDANADRVADAVAATAPTPEDSPRTRALVVAWRVKSQSSAPGARSGSRHAGPGAIFAAASSSPPPRAGSGSRSRESEPARGGAGAVPAARKIPREGGAHESQGGDADALVRAGERGARFGDGSGDAGAVREELAEKIRLEAGAATLVEIPREVHGRRRGRRELGDDNGEELQSRASRGCGGGLRDGGFGLGEHGRRDRRRGRATRA